MPIVALSPWPSVTTPVAAYEAGVLGVGVVLPLSAAELPELFAELLLTAADVPGWEMPDEFGEAELQAASRPTATNVPSTDQRMTKLHLYASVAAADRPGENSRSGTRGGVGGSNNVDAY
jgi:hypothetical protein